MPRQGEEGSSAAAAQAGESRDLRAEIEQLAYQFYLERGHDGPGSAEEDWLRAEREVTARYASGLQTSTKRGLHSSAEKTAASRPEEGPSPGAKPVPGAFGAA